MSGITIVIFAGGSGTRLWPLSTPSFPKHLLKLTGSRSLLQQAYDRARLLTNDIYIVSEVSHAGHARKQLPELPDDNILVEPARRGTAHCTIFALHEIAKKHPKNQQVVFIHADHYVPNARAFAYAIRRAAKVSRQKKAMTLVGATPTHPSPVFGYIDYELPDQTDAIAYRVAKFKEKPNVRTAKRYLASGHYLWNMGYFIAPHSVFLGQIKQYAPKLYKRYELLQKKGISVYKSFPSEPIDTEFTEKLSECWVVPGAFEWVDVGNFADLYSVHPSDDSGNVRHGHVEAESVTNSFVHNQTGVPVAVIGLDSVVVVATENGIVVANKEDSRLVGDIAKRLNS